MDMANIEEIKGEQAVFTDLWSIYKKYFHVSTDEDWDRFIQETDHLYKSKYIGTKHEAMFRDLLQDIIKQLERSRRNGSK